MHGLQEICHAAGLLPVLVTNLMMSGKVNGAASSFLLIKWLCLGFGRFVEDSPDVSVISRQDCFLGKEVGSF